MDVYRKYVALKICISVIYIILMLLIGPWLGQHFLPWLGQYVGLLLGQYTGPLGQHIDTRELIDLCASECVTVLGIGVIVFMMVGVINKLPKGESSGRMVAALLALTLALPIWLLLMIHLPGGLTSRFGLFLLLWIASGSLDRVLLK